MPRDVATLRPWAARSPAGLAAAALLLAAGCSGAPERNDPPPPTLLADPATSATETPAESGSDGDAPDAAGAPAVAAYRTWLRALADHDARAACAVHAPDFTVELRRAAVLLHRARLGDPCTGFVAVLWEEPDREYDPAAVEVTQVTDEDALLAVDFPGTDVTVALERRHGSWFVLDETPRSDVAGDPRRWLDAWCTLRTGMPRADVVALMGEPSGTYTVADGGEPQLYWTLDQYDFRAYLDSDAPDAAVLDLVGDYDRLAATDRQRVPCPELR